MIDKGDELLTSKIGNVSFFEIINRKLVVVDGHEMKKYPPRSFGPSGYLKQMVAPLGLSAAIFFSSASENSSFMS